MNRTFEVRSRMDLHFVGSLRGFLVGDANRVWVIRGLVIPGVAMIAKKTKNAVGVCSEGRRN